jgi:hypothetical protein
LSLFANIPFYQWYTAGLFKKKMAPTCENNVQIKLTPKNFLQIYQYLGIFVLPETNTCDINKAKYFNQIMKKLVIFVHFKVSIFPKT